MTDGLGPVVFQHEMDLPDVWAKSEQHHKISQDGKRYAYTEYSPDIHIVDLATKAQTEWHLEQGNIQAFSWSWDGKWIYCTGNKGSGEYFWMGRLNPDNGHFELLHEANQAHVVWPFPSPDGKTVAAQVLEVGTDIYMLEGL